MQKIALAFAAAITIGSFGASAADAMNIGSLSRQHPAIAGAELVTDSIPHASCSDVTCGGGQSKAADLSPVLHIIFVSIGGLVRSHLQPAFESVERAYIKPVSMASAD